MSTAFEGASEKDTHLPTEISGMAPAGHILLVDDDLLLLRANAELLVNAGYHINTARDGDEAWKALQNFNYDLMITDNQMPKMNGLELIKKVRAAEMALPIILASGAMPTQELERNPRLRIEALLTKPFTGDELLKVMNAALEAGGKTTDSAKLFRECALRDDGVPQNAAGAPVREQLDPAYRILVVDDNKEIRQQSIAILAGSGYEVEGAKDGAAGWDALQHSGFDLVITDNQMPNMTGIEMIARVRAAALPIPVIMATGLLPTNIIAQDPWLKPDAMLQRPFSGAELLETVRNVLSTHNGSAGGHAPAPEQRP
jgi:DNA-binding response OmpR family regulator